MRGHLPPFSSFTLVSVASAEDVGKRREQLGGEDRTTLFVSGVSAWGLDLIRCESAGVDYYILFNIENTFQTE